MEIFGYIIIGIIILYILGFIVNLFLPSNTITIEELSNKYSKPDNLLKLVTNQEIGLLALKFVEIIGEDDVSDLDPETIYFIVHILNKANLIKLRNKIIISSFFIFDNYIV